MTIEVRSPVSTGCFPDIAMQCALAKLSYLLAKGLTSDEVRSLMSTPLRGELYPPRPLISDLTTTKESRISGLFTRLLMVSGSSPNGPENHKNSLHRSVGEGFSESDLSTVEDRLNPLLVASAASRPDNTLRNLLGALLCDSPDTTKPQGLSLLNTFSTISPLHIACLHGQEQNVKLLVKAGASVHLRDIQGHTALYYAMQARDATQSQRLRMVQTLREAGAHLSLSETESRLTVSPSPEVLELWTAATGQ